MKVIFYKKKIPLTDDVAIHYVNLEQLSTISVIERSDKTIIEAVVGTVTHTLCDDKKISDVKRFIQMLMGLSNTTPIDIITVIDDCNAMSKTKRR